VLPEIIMTDISHLKTKLENARRFYKPDNIKFLLIAEAAPDTFDRFFYYPEVFKHDDLFLGISTALFPGLKEEHVIRRRRKDSSIKKIILNKFKNEGFYLLDLSELPMSLLSGSLNGQVSSLIERFKNIISSTTKIILIKTTVYDAAYLELRKHHINNVIDCRIAFPGSGQQTKFQIDFAEALKKANYKK